MTRRIDTRFGSRLHDLRQARGMSVRALAREVPCSHVHILDMEKGAKEPSPQMAGRLDTVLGASGELKELAGTRPVPEPREDVTNRRAVLVGSSLGLFGAATGGLASLPDQPWTDLSKTVDPAIVDHFAALRSVLVDSDNRLGAAWVLPSVQHVLAMIAQVRRRTRGRLHDRLLSTQSRWAEFAGWLSDDLGDGTAGTGWLSQAMTLAQEAGDLDFSSFVFARMAQRAATGEDADRVPGLARAAVSIETVHPQVRAFGMLQCARGHALTGEAREFEAAVDQARVLAESDVAPPDDLGSFCTVPYVLAQEGDGWLQLGRPETAVHRFGEALAMWPASYQRDRGLYLSRAAAAHLAKRQVGDATTLALEALELADATQSTRVRQQVMALGHRLAELGDRAAAARLLAVRDESTMAAS